MCFIKRGVKPTSTTTKICLYLGHLNCFRFIKCQWSECYLSDKGLTYKVVILMALSSASRAPAIHHLDVRSMLRPEGKFVFTFQKLHKSWKYRKFPQVLSFANTQRTTGTFGLRKL